MWLQSCVVLLVTYVTAMTWVEVRTARSSRPTILAARLAVAIPVLGTYYLAVRELMEDVGPHAAVMLLPVLVLQPALHRRAIVRRASAARAPRPRSA